MPKVTIEYELPRDQKELEGAIMGAEAVEALGKLRTWLTKEQRESRGRTESSYEAGISACMRQLELLTAPEPDDPYEREDDEER